MKFQILRERLAKALSVTNKFVQYRAQLPVLSNIYFKAEGGKLTLAATNLEMSLSQTIGAKVESEGEITIPAKTIVDLITSVNGEVLNFEIEKEQVHLTSGNFTSHLSAMNASDFPSVPKTLEKPSVTLNTRDFLDALKKVLFAVSIDETRPVLTGVLFIIEKEKLTLVATDGFRLSKKTLDINSEVEGNFILPKSILGEVSRLLSENDTFSVHFNSKENQAVLGMGDSVASSRIIEGTFPNFEKIIPQKMLFEVRVDKNEFHSAVKLAAVFARDSANVLKMKLLDSSLEIVSESVQSGTQKNVIDAKIENREGSKETPLIAFNFKFLEDFLSTVESDEISIAIIDGASPGVFHDPKDTNFLHLIMPVKLES